MPLLGKRIIYGVLILFASGIAILAIQQRTPAPAGQPTAPVQQGASQSKNEQGRKLYYPEKELEKLCNANQGVHFVLGATSFHVPFDLLDFGVAHSLLKSGAKDRCPADAPIVDVRFRLYAIQSTGARRLMLERGLPELINFVPHRGQFEFRVVTPPNSLRRQTPEGYVANVTPYVFGGQPMPAGHETYFVQPVARHDGAMPPARIVSCGGQADQPGGRYCRASLRCEDGYCSDYQVRQDGLHFGGKKVGRPIDEPDELPAIEMRVDQLIQELKKQ